MAHHASAKKRIRQNTKKNLYNRQNTSRMKTAIKRVHEAIDEKRMTEVPELLKLAQSTIAKTKQKGVIHRNQMSRRISRLFSHVQKALNPQVSSKS
jgi:small subunit ribosomal protein S20